MQYMLQFRETPEERAKPNDTAQAGAYWGGWQAYIGALAQSGAMVGGNVLRPPETATTLRVENGTRHVVDGPIADTKEQLAGFVLLEVPDLDAALDRRLVTDIHLDEFYACDGLHLGDVAYGAEYPATLLDKLHGGGAPDSG